MAKGMIREVFPGGNTSQGFFSYYDFIIAPDATRIMVIKGGPGVGKSSFMKAIAAEMIERGYDVELHHCSSDNNSLDGVVFPQLNVAMIDGTSPHVVDPKNPGAVDEILHLGDYWDEKGMRRNKAPILELNREVGKLFRRAYRFLKAAKAIHDDLEAVFQEGFDAGLANQKTADLEAAIFENQPVSRKAGSLRKLFASAITPDGFRNYLPTLLEPIPTVYGISGAPGTGKSTLLEKIAAGAVLRGYQCEAFYCAFDPLKMEHLIIRDLDAALTTLTECHRYNGNNVSSVVNMDECVGASVQTKYGDLIQSDQKLIDNLFETVFLYLHQAKVTHDQMEQYYVPNMNFQAIGGLRDRTLRRILSYAEENKLVGV